MLQLSSAYAQMPLQRPKALQLNSDAIEPNKVQHTLITNPNLKPSTV